MATVIYAEPEVASRALFGGPSHETQRYLQTQASAFYGALSEAGRNTMASFKEFIGRDTADMIARKAAAINNLVHNYFEEDSVRYLSNVGQTQNAPDSMVRWVMTTPALRPLYDEGRIEGYGDRYVDVEPGKVGADHYDYRLSTSGLAMETENGYVCTNYYEKLRADETVLNFNEKVSIQRTRDLVNFILEESDLDPTSKWNDKIMD